MVFELYIFYSALPKKQRSKEEASATFDGASDNAKKTHSSQDSMAQNESKKYHTNANDYLPREERFIVYISFRHEEE